MVKFEVASSTNFRDSQKTHFVTAEAVEAHIGDGIKRKRIRVSLKNTKRLGYFLISAPSTLSGELKSAI